MSQTTDRLSLPLLAAGQAQKHVTHNEALFALDSLVHLHIDARMTAPPISPINGQHILIDAPATGIFAGHATHVAVHDAAGWRFLTPKRGWLAILQGAANLLAFDGSAWVEQAPDKTSKIGINTTADTTNRLAVASEAALFTHVGASSQIKVNKAAPANTASLLFQTNWSGRAEMGLNGSDGFSIKTSANGSAWNEAISVNATSGAARFPSGLEHTSGALMRSLVFTPGGDGTVSILRLDELRSAHPRTETIASITGDVITLSSATAGRFFHAMMAGVSYVRMWNISKAPAQPCWIKATPANNQLRVFDAAALTGWTAGDVIQLSDPTPSTVPTRAFAVDISPMLHNVLGSVFRQSAVLMKAGTSANAALASLAVSGTAGAGSFINVSSQPNGALNVGMVIMPTPVQSPISNSNLLFFREDETAPNTMTTTLASAFGVFV